MKMKLEDLTFTLQSYKAANKQLLKEKTDLVIEVAKLKEKLAKYQASDGQALR